MGTGRVRASEFGQGSRIMVKENPIHKQQIDPVLMAVLLIAGAVAGNTINYHIGRYIGPRVFSMNTRLLNRAALLRAHAFYEKHGGKTIVLSRFIPILRTFAPFVAGVALMSVARFQLFNIAGALLWVISLITAGYLFGNIPLVRDHLNTIVLLGLAAASGPLLLGGLWKLARSANWRRPRAPAGD